MSSPDTHALLARYREAITPGVAARERLVAAVTHAVATTTPAATVPAVRAATRLGRLWLVGVIGVALGGLAVASRPRDTAAPPSAGAAASREPEAAIEPAARELDATVRDAAIPSAAASLRPAAVASAHAEAPQRSATTRTEPPRARRPRAAAAPTPPEPDASLEIDAEVALLRRAAAALGRGEDAEAAALYREHAERFARGALIELREAGLARLRCRAQDDDDAVLADFLARFPGSPHAARLQRECTPP